MHPKALPFFLSRPYTLAPNNLKPQTLKPKLRPRNPWIPSLLRTVTTSLPGELFRRLGPVQRQQARSLWGLGPSELMMIYIILYFINIIIPDYIIL